LSKELDIGFIEKTRKHRFCTEIDTDIIFYISDEVCPCFSELWSASCEFLDFIPNFWYDAHKEKCQKYDEDDIENRDNNVGRRILCG
jgi:hypothetical protein